MEVGTFVLHRFSGDEVYAVKSATITASAEGDAVDLFLYLDTRAKPIKTLPDTAELDPRPNAEIHITLKKFDVSKLVGRRFSIPASWDDEKQDHIACLYYCDHGELDKNVVRFLERDGSKFLVHWTATTTDVNYYDGSKPNIKVEIRAWFTFKHLRKWASAEPGTAPDRGRNRR